MCTGRDLVARVARARLPYAENLVSGTGLAYMRVPIQHKHKHMRRCAFLGRACTRGAIMRRASTAGAGATTWVRGVGAWRRGWAASVGGVVLAAGRACGNGVRVGMSGAGRRGAFRRCRFECAWTLGLVRCQRWTFRGLVLVWNSPRREGMLPAGDKRGNWNVTWFPADVWPGLDVYSRG